MELFTFLKLVTLIRTLSSQSCDAAWTGSEEQGMMLARPHATPRGSAELLWLSGNEEARNTCKTAALDGCAGSGINIATTHCRRVLNSAGIAAALILKEPLCILFLDMGKCPLTKGKQALEIRSSLSEKRALTDPVQQSTPSAEALARNLQWAKAHGTVQSAFGWSYCHDGRRESLYYWMEMEAIQGYSYIFIAVFRWKFLCWGLPLHEIVKNKVTCRIYVHLVYLRPLRDWRAALRVVCLQGQSPSTACLAVTFVRCHWSHSPIISWNSQMNCMVNVHDEKKFSRQTTKKKIRLRWVPGFPVFWEGQWGLRSFYLFTLLEYIFRFLSQLGQRVRDGISKTTRCIGRLFQRCRCLFVIPST